MKFKSVRPTLLLTSAEDNYGIQELKINIALTFMKDDFDM